MTLLRFWYSFRVFWGAPICPVCGSRNIVERGFVDFKKNKNKTILVCTHRHDCKDCGVESWV